MKKFLDEKFFKFALVGLLNTVVGYAINVIALNVLNLPFMVAGVLNYGPTSVMSFFLNKYFTFKSKGDLRKEAIRFAVNIAVCFTLAYGIAQPFTSWVMGFMPQSVFGLIEKLTFGLLTEKQNIIDNVATLVGMVLFVIFNYTGQRFFAFKDEE